MSAWVLLLFVAIAGALGGAFASLSSEDKGFVWPRKVTESSKTVWRPGWIGLVLVGALAAGVSYALYGPIAGVNAIGGPDPTEGTPDNQFGITFGALFAALLVGMGGSKYLASQVDKVLLQETAAKAASGQSDTGKAAVIAGASPTEALKIANLL